MKLTNNQIDELNNFANQFLAFPKEVQRAVIGLISTVGSFTEDPDDYDSVIWGYIEALRDSQE